MSGRAVRRFAVTLALAAGVAACTPSREPGLDASRALRVSILTDEGTLNPYSYVTGYPGWNMLTLVYDTLFALDAQNQPRPWVARADEPSADGLIRTLTLRDDVTWHDGRPLTSADVRFSYEYYQAHPHARWSAPVRNLVRIDIPDPVTVVLHLRAADPSLPVRLLADVPIVPRHVWETVTDPRTFTGAVGSGPFRLAEYRADHFYRFTAHHDYFAGRPRVEALLMPVIKDPATTFAALETGEIDGTIDDLPPELVSRFAGRPDLSLSEGAGYATTLLQFNCERAPWSDPRVRRAVALAIDTSRLVETLLLGRGTPGNPGWLHPASPLHDPAVTAEFSVDEANALLDTAGLIDRDGDGVREWQGQPLAPVLLAQANDPIRTRAAELIADAVAAIGIRARVRAEEPGSLSAKVWPDFDVARGRSFDWTMFGWSAPIMVDPQRMVSLVDSDARYGTNNIGGFRSADADRIGARLRATLDPGARRHDIQALESLIAAERPFIVLWYPDLTFAWSPRTFRGWAFQAGQGIFHKHSFVGFP